ncbi:hypothetical protein F2Q68_00040434 [Brassica cretica]|uniref:Myb-like domain-containing protein n=1 Tax=Brassica cretica TaxID=69181 RepID=A0A8S9MHH9_BRACR|nr:hypothetical protein F2Q68_00040434 [Brassica cretica]
MDSYPYNNNNAKFVDLQNSQQEVVFGFGQDTGEVSSSQVPLFGTQRSEDSHVPEDSPAECKERRTWTPPDDILLISSWLITSKDPVVENEQKSGAFWKRIAAYFAASQKVAGSEVREHSHCKQRWHKINDQKKFTLEHAWKELRNDQKWCELSTSKSERSSKRRKCDEAAQSSTSQATETNNDQATARPPGVKASKGLTKQKTKAVVKAAAEFHSMWRKFGHYQDNN